jgi:hypothetical protein
MSCYFDFTRASIHACRKAGRHIVTMEEDEDVFKALLQSLIIENVSQVFKKQRLDEHVVELGLEVEVEEEPPLPKLQNKFCTQVHPTA